MARAYCTPDDVKQFLPKNPIAEGSSIITDFMNPSTVDVTSADIDYFIQMASMHIDSTLSTQYYTPFALANQGGIVSYPFPIPRLCALLTAVYIYEQRLQGTDRANSETQKARKDEAQNILFGIQNGEYGALAGATFKGMRFVQQGLFNIPKNPAEGGRSKNEK